MDENPYKSPESGKAVKRVIRFTDRVAIAAGIALVVSLIVELFTESSSPLDRPASIVHDPVRARKRHEAVSLPKGKSFM